MELIVLARAENEILETQARLEDLAEGLGVRFNLRAEEALDRLQLFPEIGSVYSGRFRKVLVRDFPFAIFYSIEGRRIIIQAVSDLRQDPKSLRRRLDLE